MTYSDDEDGPIGIVFDPAKDRANKAKHGVSLELASMLFRQHTVVEEDQTMAYGEQRFIALGLIGTSVYCCVYVERGPTVRVISLRKANKRETARYFQRA